MARRHEPRLVDAPPLLPLPTSPALVHARWPGALLRLSRAGRLTCAGGSVGVTRHVTDTGPNGSNSADSPRVSAASRVAVVPATCGPRAPFSLLPMPLLSRFSRGTAGASLRSCNAEYGRCRIVARQKRRLPLREPQRLCPSEPQPPSFDRLPVTRAPHPPPLGTMPPRAG